MVIHFGYLAKIVDVETAFLYRGACQTCKKIDCIILNKCIYCLVQASRQYYKKAVKILKNSGFVGSNVNPCLYIKKSVKGIVYVALYVDDNLMLGNMNNASAALKSKGLVLKIVEGLQDYLSCKIKISVDKKRA